MPSILSLSVQSGSRLWNVAARFFRVMRNRHCAAMLNRLDDRMLADIGITRSDLRDAYAEPLWHDPTDVLARRAHERRSNRPRRMEIEPLTQGRQGLRYPPTGRSSRYLI